MCARSVYFNKILGIPNKTKYASTSYGSAMHNAVEYLFKEKLAGKLPKIDSVIDVFISKISEQFSTINVWGEDTESHLIEQGQLACQDFYKNFWSLEPMYVEKEFLIQREGKMPIKCIADMVDKFGTVYDFKFGRGMWGSAVTGEYMLNMATYALCYANEFQEIPKIKLIKEKWSGSVNRTTRKKKWSHKEFVVDEMNISQAWLDYYLGVYDTVEKGITSNVWLPAQDNNGLCKQCGYRGKECDIVIMGESYNEDD